MTSTLTMILGICVAWIGMGLGTHLLVLFSEMAAVKIRGPEYGMQIQKQLEEKNFEGKAGISVSQLLLWPLTLCFFLCACFKKQTVLEWLIEQKTRQDEKKAQRKKLEAELSRRIIHTGWVRVQELPDSYMRVQAHANGQLVPTHIVARIGALDLYVASRIYKDQEVHIQQHPFTTSSRLVAQLFCDKDTEWIEACLPGNEAQRASLYLSTEGNVSEGEAK